jgi:hypothetical protein
MYLVIGEGDQMLGTPPNYGLNPRGPSSPIFSSVLTLRFSTDIDSVSAPLTLTQDDQYALLEFLDVELQNTAGQKVTISTLTQLRPAIRNLTPAAPYLIVRESNPYGAVLDRGNQNLYLTDASRDSVYRIDTKTGRRELLVRFPPFQRQTGTETTVVDNVPNGICFNGDELLVSFLSASRFPPGEGRVLSVDTRDGTVRPFIVGLTAVIDVGCSARRNGDSRFYTLEWTRDFANLAVPSGRLRVWDDPAGRTLVDNLVLPTGMATDPITGDIFIAEPFPLTGARITRVPAPQ